MNVGQWNYRVTIKAPTMVSDGIGGFNVVYGDIITTIAAGDTYTIAFEDTGEQENGEPIYRSVDPIYFTQKSPDTSLICNIGTSAVELRWYGPTDFPYVYLQATYNSANLGTLRAINYLTGQNEAVFSGVSQGAGFTGWSTFQGALTADLSLADNTFGVVELKGDRTLFADVKEKKANRGMEVGAVINNKMYEVTMRKQLDLDVTEGWLIEYQGKKLEVASMQEIDRAYWVFNTIERGNE